MKNTLGYILFLLGAIVVYWLTFIEKIGLHGDEAYFGLDAVDMINKGITRPYGMNTYTGMLQSLSNSVLFRLFDINVTTLRLSGILSNIIALSLAVTLLKKAFNNSSVLLFLLLFTQSVLLLGYSKIAWEVCSFNFLFMMLAIAAIHQLQSLKTRTVHLAQFLFLFVTFLSTYNHILFSSFVVAIFFGLIFKLIFTSAQPTKLLLDVLTLSSISLVNITLLFLLMNHSIDAVWADYGKLLFVLPFLIIGIQVLLFQKIRWIMAGIAHFLAPKSPPLVVRLIIMLLPIIAFAFFHFLNVFEVLSNKIVLMRLFSYEFPLYLEFYFIGAASVLLGYVLYKLIADILKNTNAIWTYILIAYLGVLCVYTQGDSIRYFLICILLVFFYLSIQLSQEQKKIRMIFMALLLISTVSIQSILWSINLNPERPVKGIKFKIAGEFKETSAHFLNFSPVLDYVQTNKVGVLETKQRFFINYVFKFYKKAYPEINTYIDTAEVNYNYDQKGSGFIMRKFTSHD